MTERALQPCGTVAAYQRHIRAHQEPDVDFRAAWAAYAAEWKAEHPPTVEAKEADRKRSAARARALWRLRLENDTRYLELYTQELNGGDPDD